VIVAGASSWEISKRARIEPGLTTYYLLGQIATLLYIRTIGAEQMMVFRPRPHVRRDQRPLAARALELPDLDAARKQYVEAVMSSGAPVEDLVFEGQRWHGWVHVPGGNRRLVDIPLLQDTPRKAISRAAAGIVFDDAADSLVGDALSARVYRAPLAIAYEFHERWLAKRVRPPSEAEVALNLSLPVLQYASPRDIMQLRQEERTSFEAFQLALRSAIRQQVAMAVDGRTSRDIARVVSEGFIKPALSDIERSIRAATRTMLRKSGVRAIVAATTEVTTGLLTGYASAVAAGIGLALGASTLQPLDNYIDARKEIELKDMYFLWKAERCSPSI